MNTATTFNDIQYAASICLKCGSCTYGDWPENHRLCSLYYRDECFTHGGGGFMSIVTALAENLLPFDKKIADLAYTCSGCLACDSRCSIIKNHPPKAEMIDMIRLLRYEAVKKGLAPKAVMKIRDSVKNGRGLALPKAGEGKTDLIVYADPGNKALASLLGKIGASATLRSDSVGVELYDYGFWDDLKPVMERAWAGMKELSRKTFVFTNPHSEEFVVRRYPENIAGCTGISHHRHITQLLAEALEKGKLKSKKTSKTRVSFHDPCYLGRGLDVYEEPRAVLTALAGVELVEMARNRKSSYCCGARSVGSYFPDHATYMAKERLAEFEATGADILITACPHCKESFQKASPEGKKERIVDIVEFVDRRV